MAPRTLLATLAEIRRAPLAYLSSRRLRSLATFLAGRDLALANYGLAGWSDLPIDKLIAGHYGVELMPWRSWIDLVEYSSADEWAAFDAFLALSSSWPEPAPTSVTIQAPSYELDQLLDRIAAHPGMYLGDPTLASLADLLSGYITTTESIASADATIARYRALCGSIESGSPGHAWFKTLRFNVSSDEEAWKMFFEAWQRA